MEEGGGSLVSRLQETPGYEARVEGDELFTLCCNRSLTLYLTERTVESLSGTPTPLLPSCHTHTQSYVANLSHLDPIVCVVLCTSDMALLCRVR